MTTVFVVAEKLAGTFITLVIIHLKVTVK